jgi:hypothetical protein
MKSQIVLIALLLAGCGSVPKPIATAVIPDLPKPAESLLIAPVNPRCVKNKGSDISVREAVDERDCFKVATQQCQASLTALQASSRDTQTAIADLRKAPQQPN